MKYLPTGECVEVIEEIASGVLVEMLLCAADEDVDAGPMRVVPKKDLLDNPPVARIDAQVKAKQAELESVSRQLRAKRQEIAEAERETAERLKRLKQYKPLEFLEDFLEGKITHYAVMQGWTADIVTPAIAKEDRDYSWDASKVKLLTLFGNSKGQLDWGLSRYGGGGGEQTVIPCRSEAEAREVVERWVNEGWENDTMRPDLREHRIRAAERLGLFVQPSLIEASRQRKLDAARVEMAKAVAVLAEKRALLQAAESALAPKTPASGEPANG